MSDQFRCPQCGTMVPTSKEKRPETFPFCSHRCRLVDLGSWADGSYVVQGRQLTVDTHDGFDDPLDDLRRQAQRTRGVSE